MSSLANITFQSGLNSPEPLRTERVNTLQELNEILNKLRKRLQGMWENKPANQEKPEFAHYALFFPALANSTYTVSTVDCRDLEVYVPAGADWAGNVYEPFKALRLALCEISEGTEYEVLVEDATEPPFVYSAETYEEALEIFNKVSELDSISPEPLYELGFRFS